MFFFFDKTLWDQQRKRYVLMAGGFESSIKRLLNVLPQRPAVGPHDHAAAHRRVIGQLRLQYQLVVPLGKVLCSCRKFFFSHAALYRSSAKRICIFERKSVTDTPRSVNERRLTRTPLARSFATRAALNSGAVKVASFAKVYA